MKTRTFCKVGVLLIIVMCAAIMCIVLFPNTTNVAAAQTYTEILKYTGSQHNFAASVSCPTSVTSTSAVNSFSIRCYSTKLEYKYDCRNGAESNRRTNRTSC